MSEPVVQSRRSIYIGGLADEVKEATLRAVCLPFGPIKSIEIPMDFAKGNFMFSLILFLSPRNYQI